MGRDHEKTGPGSFVGHAYGVIQQETDDGDMECRKQHGVRDVDMGQSRRDDWIMINHQERQEIKT